MEVGFRCILMRLNSTFGGMEASLASTMRAFLAVIFAIERLFLVALLFCEALERL